MRIIAGDGLFDVVLEENVVNTIIIENPELYGKYVNELIHQCDGDEGAFILSENEKLLNISKKMFVILNPFEVNINDKKIINRIYKDVESIVKEEYLVDYAELNSQIFVFLDKVLGRLPYALDYDVDSDIIGLLKQYDVKLSCIDMSYFDKLIEFLRAMKHILSYEICVFVNLKSFVTEKQLNDLLEFCCYNKLHIILLENVVRPIANAFEHCKIIDKDFCIIDVK